MNEVKLCIRCYFLCRDLHNILDVINAPAVGGVRLREDRGRDTCKYI